MPKVTYIDHDGGAQTIDVPVGENVMRGALYNGIEGIVGECGGGLACATCHCYIDEAWAERVGGCSVHEPTGRCYVEISASGRGRRTGALDPKPD